MIVLMWVLFFNSLIFLTLNIYRNNRYWIMLWGFILGTGFYFILSYYVPNRKFLERYEQLKIIEIIDKKYKTTYEN